MAINRKARCVLIVEDEMLVAMHLEDLLNALGHEVGEIATRIDKAIEIAGAGKIDFAVLDVNLAGTKSFPVADILRERNIPFIFATGYGAEGMVDGYREEAVVHKPYTSQQLSEAFEQVLSRPG